MEQAPRLPLWFLVANWSMVMLALATGWFLGSRRVPDFVEPQGRAIQLVYDQILQSHIEPQDGAVLLDRAIGAMVDELDPYSRYVPPSEADRYDESNTGHYEGIGVVMVQHGEDLVVHWPMAGGPAERAGLRPGDRLLAVDDRDLRQAPTEQRHATATQLVRGAAGTTVRLRIAPFDGSPEHEVVVERSGVQQTSVKWAHVADRENGLGYVYLEHFQGGSAADLQHAIEGLQKNGLRGLVLDLRGNPGGSLDECVALANLFLRDGNIVSTRRRDSTVVERFDAKADACHFPDLPLALLVDDGSASASEVLSGALHDHQRATLVGTATYGKGYVNTNYTWKKLPFRLRLTTGQYFTPAGRNIERPNRLAVKKGEATPEQRAAFEAGGIHPDVDVPVTKEERLRIVRSLDALEPPAAQIPALTAAAAKHGFAVPAAPAAADDPQLAKALDTLRDRVANPPSNGAGKPK